MLTAAELLHPRHISIRCSNCCMLLDVSVIDKLVLLAVNIRSPALGLVPGPVVVYEPRPSEDPRPSQ